MINSDSIFDFPIYNFQCDPALTDAVLNEISNVPVVRNTSNKTSAIDDADLNFSYYNEALITWFTECVKQVKEIHYVPEIELVITECWGNRSNRFEKHHTHIHPNSIISGILYLSDHPTVTTNFYQPNPWAWPSPMLSIVKKSAKLQVGTIVPEVGKLVIFPSNLMHDTKPNLGSSSRITISFNTFVSGKFGMRSSYLGIAPNSLMDIF